MQSADVQRCAIAAASRIRGRANCNACPDPRDSAPGRCIRGTVPRLQLHSKCAAMCYLLLLRSLTCVFNLLIISALLNWKRRDPCGVSSC